MNVFKKGDRVRRIKDGACLDTKPHRHKGYECTFARCSPTMPATHFRDTDNQSHMFDSFELVVAPKSSFNVGDRVEVLMGMGSRRAGSVVTITRSGKKSITLEDGGIFIHELALLLFKLAVPERKPRVGDTHLYKGGGDLLVIAHFEGRKVWFEDGTWLSLKMLAASYPLIKEFDCSDTGNVTLPDKGGNKEEESMSDFVKGDRVYRDSLKSVSWCANGDRGTVLSVRSSGSLKIEMDNGHVTPNGSSKAFTLVTPRTATTVASNNKEDNMSTFTIRIESQTVVNGLVITKNTSEETLYGFISDAEAEQKRLDEMKNKPASVTAKIEALQAGIEGIVAICDKRSGSTTPSDNS